MQWSFKSKKATFHKEDGLFRLGRSSPDNSQPIG